MKILSLCPSRISLVGGGTDVDPFCSEYGGRVLNMAINLRQKIELYTGDDMWGFTKDMFPYNAKPDLFYKILDNYGLNGMHLHRVLSQFDGQIGAGLGSSAASAVALIGALRKCKGLPLDRMEIAKEAYEIEVDQMGWHGGRQDQYASSLGGINMIDFGKEVKVTPLPKKAGDELLKWSFLTYIGNRRSSHRIQNAFKELTIERKRYLDRIKERVVMASVYLTSYYMQFLGELMDETWQLKKESNKGVSNKEIDNIYGYAKKNGAIGGKILGAGGGGYMYFIISPDKRDEFKKKMMKKGLEEVDFSIDYNGLDVRIV